MIEYNLETAKKYPHLFNVINIIVFTKDDIPFTPVAEELYPYYATGQTSKYASPVSTEEYADWYLFCHELKEDVLVVYTFNEYISL